MTIVNPDLPQSKELQYWGKIFHPIGNVEGQKFSGAGTGFGEAIAGAGKFAEHIVSAADDAVQVFAKRDASEDARIRRDERESLLEDVTDASKGGTAPASAEDVSNVPIGASRAVDAQGNEQPSILPDENKMPLDLRNLPEKLKSMDLIRANGKWTDTQFYGEVAKSAKDIRARYPSGYWPYIDQQYSHILGVDPANAYAASMVRDFNAAVANAQAARNHIETQLRTAEHDGVVFPDGGNAATLAAEFRAGKRTQTYVENKLNNAYSYKYTSAVLKAQLDNAQNQSAYESHLAGKFVDREFVAIQGSVLTPILEKVQDPEFKKNLTGPGAVEVQRDFTIAEGVAEKRMRNILTARGPDGRTLYDKMGSKAAEDLIAEHLKPYQLGKAGFAAMAGMTAKLSQALKDEDFWTLQNDPKLGTPGRMYEALVKLYGQDQAQNIVNKHIQEILTAPHEGLYKTFQSLAIKTNDPNNPYYTLRKATEDAQKQGIAKIPGYVHELATGAVYDLVDPKTPREAKKVIASSLTDPDNWTLLDHIKDERGKTGKTSQWEVFNLLSSEKVVKEVMDTGDRRIIDNHKNLMEHYFNTLLGKEVKDLNDIRDTKFLDLRWDDGKDTKQAPAWHLIAKNEQGKIVNDRAEVSNAGVSEMDIQPRQSVAQARKSINALNTGLINLNALYKAHGIDSTSQLIRTFKELGFGVSPDYPLIGLSKSMLETILGAARKPVEPENKTIPRQ